MGWLVERSTQEEDNTLEEAISITSLGERVEGCHSLEQMLGLRQDEEGAYTLSLLRAEYVDSYMD